LNELKSSSPVLLGEKDRGEFPFELRADEKCAQILMTIHSAEGLKKARSIIEEFGIDVLEMRSITPNDFLFRLNVMDMRDVVLKLTENGFSGLKGINALAFKKGR
jgi:hypothetical protein